MIRKHYQTEKLQKKKAAADQIRPAIHGHLKFTAKKDGLVVPSIKGGGKKSSSFDTGRHQSILIGSKLQVPMLLLFRI